jgi:hypothetical protein
MPPPPRPPWQRKEPWPHLEHHPRYSELYAL